MIPFQLNEQCRLAGIFLREEQDICISLAAWKLLKIAVIIHTAHIGKHDDHSQCLFVVVEFGVGIILMCHLDALSDFFAIHAKGGLNQFIGFLYQISKLRSAAVSCRTEEFCSNLFIRNIYWFFVAIISKITKMYEQRQHIISIFNIDHIILEGFRIYFNLFSWKHRKNCGSDLIKVSVNIKSEWIVGLGFCPITAEFSVIHRIHNRVWTVNRFHSAEGITIIPSLAFLKVHLITLTQILHFRFGEAHILCKLTRTNHSILSEIIQRRLCAVFLDGQNSGDIGKFDEGISPSTLEHSTQEVNIIILQRLIILCFTE